MKKILYFTLAAALSAAALVSCNKIIEDEINNDDPQVVDPEVDQPAAPIVETLTFAIQGDEATKAVLSNGSNKHCVWDNGDKIGTIVTAGDAGYSTVDASTTPVTFSVKNTGGFVAGETIYAWFPFGNKEMDPEIVAMSIPSEQYMNGSVFDFSTMPMASKGITITEEMVRGTADQTTVDEIAFYNLASLIDFKIFASSSYTTERVLSVTFNASGNIAGNFSKNLTVIDPAVESTLNISGYTETSVTTNVIPFSTVGTSSESPLDVYMVVAPGSYTGNVVVVTDAATYTWTISSAKDFQRSHVKPLGLQLDKASGPNFSRVAHVKGSFAWDLSTVSWNSMDDNYATWSHGLLTLHASKGSGTKLTNYTPPTYASTRFYSNNTLDFTVGSLQIEKVEFTTTSSGYATALASSTWENAVASAAETKVTVAPTDGSDDFSATLGGTSGITKIQVYYDDNTYSIDGSSSPVAGGTFTIKKGASDVTEAKVNTTITLGASPNSGYIFTSWAVKDDENNDIPVVDNHFQMPASDVTITANFAEVSSLKTIYITTPSNGTVSTDPEGSAAPGDLVTITATPASGYEVETISVIDEDSAPVSVSNNQFTMPNKEVTVTVTFQQAYVLTAVNSTQNTSYGSNYDVTQNSITWSAPGNQNFAGFWKLGGKKNKAADPTFTETRVIYGKEGASTIGFNVSTIKIATNGVDNVNVTVNSITVTAHSNADDAASGSSAYATFTTSDNLTFGVSTDKALTFTKTGSADCTSKYYRIAFNISNTTTTNHGLQLVSITFTE